MPFITHYTIPQEQAEAVPVGLTWSGTQGSFVTINPAGVFIILGLSAAIVIYRRSRKAA